MRAKTTQAKEIWRKGDRVIHEVTLEIDGQPKPFKTYSMAIATEGWEGEVETYEKAGNRGMETFVKQPPKEGGFPSSGSGKAPYVPKDEKAIQAMWAIKTSALTIGPILVKDDIHDTDSIQDIESLATELFRMVDRVKAGTTPDDNGPETPADLSTVDELLR